MTTFPERLGLQPTDPDDTDRPGDDAGQRLRVTEEMCNVNGGLHGGVIATMLDTTMGAAARAGQEEGKSAVTVTMTVTYLGGAEVGDELVASAEVRKSGGTLTLLEADITRVGDDAPIAHGVATFRIIDAD